MSYRDVDGHASDWDWPGDRESFNLIAGPRFTGHDTDDCLLILD